MVAGTAMKKPRAKKSKGESAQSADRLARKNRPKDVDGEYYQIGMRISKKARERMIALRAKDPTINWSLWFEQKLLEA